MFQTCLKNESALTFRIIIYMNISISTKATSKLHIYHKSGCQYEYESKYEKREFSFSPHIAQKFLEREEGKCSFFH